MELEARVKLLEKLKAMLEHQVERADKKAISFDRMIDIAKKEYNNFQPRLLYSIKKPHIAERLLAPASGSRNFGKPL
jgi:transposase